MIWGLFRPEVSAKRFFPVLFVILVDLIVFSAAFAGPASGIVFEVTQPDGTTFMAMGFGDEWCNGVSTEEGYGIIQDITTGWWYYAVPDEMKGAIMSGYPVGKIVPADYSIPMGLREYCGFHFSDGVGFSVYPTSYQAGCFFGGDSRRSRPLAFSLELKPDPNILFNLTIDVNVEFCRFTSPVDIYIGIYAPQIDPDIYLMMSDSRLQPLTKGAAKWKENVWGIVKETIINDIPLYSLPGGDFDFYIMVTPAGNMDIYYLWKTYF
ncbi:MAG: hypothetical protein HZA17_05790 [Nitrospirae bacterium]|nr:hypothetical protein [Nitrospirota bacterium]